MDIWKKIFRRKHTYHMDHMDPDEVFLDAKNLPEFNTQQFEGVMERPISKNAIVVGGIVLALVGCLFIGRLWSLQIAKGEAYFERSESNYVYRELVFGDRGIIFDRKGEPLAWNVSSETGEPFSYRKYTDAPGFGHILGYVRYPKKDQAGFYWRTELEGVEGAEAYYEPQLRGEPGSQLIEMNVKKEIVSSGRIEEAQDGENITLTLDAGIQAVLHEQLAEMSRQFGYEGGGGVIMDVHTGDIIALTNYPEYSPELLSLGEDRATIQGYFTDESKPMLNRMVSGLYTPGSIVKPFFALGALNEGVITPSKKIMSTGYIEIPNPYTPSEPSRFYDWRWGRYKTGHGATDVYHAIADSVNTYMYAIGGGYKDQRGIGIAGIEKYAKLFKLTEPTGFALGGEKQGTIPTPEWKAEVFDGDAWRLGDTYNTVIGQFGFQSTPLEMVRAAGALANGGTLVKPRLSTDEKIVTETVSGIDHQYYSVIRKALRETVLSGTAQNLDVSYVDIAVKTGTAQTSGNRKINAWAMGFWPYEDPQYAFVVLAEGAESGQTVGASWAVRNVFDWMNENTPEYLR